MENNTFWRMVERLWIVGLFFVLGISFLADAYSPVKEDCWKKMDSAHFVLWYRCDVPKRFVYKLKKKAELYYRRIMQDLGLGYRSFWMWENRCVIYIYRDRDDFVKYVPVAPNWAWGTAVVERRQIHCYYLSEMEDSVLLDIILPHEMTHLIFYDARDKAPIPHFLDEGIAMRQERDNRRDICLHIVDEAFKDGGLLSTQTLFNFGEYSKMDRETAQVFYSESLLLVEFFLERFPKSCFATLCWRLRSGMPFKDAFLRSYPRYIKYGNIDWEKLDSDFLSFLRELGVRE